jgi:hypothetical protein
MVQEQYTPVVAEHLAPAVTFEQLDNVFIFTLRDLSRQSIDAWAKKVQAVLDNWPEGEPILTLHHFDTPYATLTPYLKACADQLNNRKHLSRTALVLPRTALTQLMVSLLPKLSRGKAARVFTSREEALAWLQTAV